MSEVGNRLKARFAGRRTRVLVPEFVDVLEPDSRGELAIYAAPYTLADDQRLAGYTRDDDSEGFAQVLVDKAEDESGARLFGLEDRAVLMQCVEAHVIKRLAMEIMSSVTLADAEGN